MSAPNLNTYAGEIPGHIKDDGAALGPEDYTKAVNLAVPVYSKRFPREIVFDLESDGTGDFAVSDLEGFSEKLSTEIKIEYPISETGEEENYLSEKDFKLVRTPDGLFVRVFYDIPDGETARFSYSGLHVVNEDGSTIPEDDSEVIEKLAAAEACMMLSRHYSSTTEGTVVDSQFAAYNTKDRTYKKRADELRAEAWDTHAAWGIV